MSYIGQKPADKLVTSSDMEDGIVTTAKIADSSVTTEKIVADTNFRNIVINGDMSISQRHGTSSVTQNDNIYSVDRFGFYASQSSKLTVQQNAGSVTPPSGFKNYLGYTSSSAYTVGASETFISVQVIEGYNVAYLDFGTANAKSITLSFWVRSSLTGTFGGALRNADATRSYPFTYSISVANTWEKKSITFEGDTSGTWNTTNGYGLGLMFGLGVGSTVSSTAGSWQSGAYYSATGATSVVGTDGATFYITGVQLEAGTTASDFEFLPVDINRYRCFRYCYRINGNASDQQQCGAIGFATSSSAFNAMMRFSPHMRTAPTVTEDNMSQTTTGSAISLTGGFDNSDTSDCNATGLSFSADSGTPFTTGNVMFPRVNDSTSAFIQFDSEL
jgi:hypothetical protein